MSSTPPARTAPTGAEYRAAIRAAYTPGASAAAATRLGASLRELNRVAVGSTAPDEVLDEVAAEIDRLTARIRPDARPSRYEQALAISGEGTFINHPMIGPANPCAPLIAMRVDDDRLVGEVTFGPPQEGPPGHGYGGYLAAGFDAILLMTAGINELGGPTKSMAIRYRLPTPLNVPLRYVAEIGNVEERVVHVHGRLVGDDDTVYVEGSAEVAHRATIGNRPGSTGS
jgi:hypothetical protein